MLFLNCFQLAADFFAVCVVNELQELGPNSMDFLTLDSGGLKVLVRDAKNLSMLSNALMTKRSAHDIRMLQSFDRESVRCDQGACDGEISRMRDRNEPGNVQLLR